VLVRCWLALGRLDDARAAATAAASVAQQFRLPRSEAMARLAAADVALHVGDADGAVDHAEASVIAAETVSARVDAAMARTLLGQALARAGRVAEAVVVLERAAADLDSFGAIRHRDRAEHELRKLGHRMHRRPERGKASYGLAALSGRELEVARLVVDRRTNPEIAADLFLSLKTVESHMRNIFRKLEVSSRVGVARVVEKAAPS
jgi:DNA-binding NarL/FixJ family response regulator